MAVLIAKTLDLLIDFTLKVLGVYHLVIGEFNTAALFFIATGVYSISMAMGLILTLESKKIIGAKEANPDKYPSHRGIGVKLMGEQKPLVDVTRHGTA